MFPARVYWAGEDSFDQGKRLGKSAVKCLGACDLNERTQPALENSAKTACFQKCDKAGKFAGLATRDTIRHAKFTNKCVGLVY